MRPFLLILRAAVALGLAVEAYVAVLWIGPDAEAALAPVLAHQGLGLVERDAAARAVCFTWSFDKVRPARAVDANWTLRADDMAYPYQRVRTVADSEGVAAGLIARPVKTEQWSRKCIDLPETLTGRPFRITGFVEYETRLTGGWWTVRQPTATARVP